MSSHTYNFLTHWRSPSKRQKYFFRQHLNFITVLNNKKFIYSLYNLRCDNRRIKKMRLKNNSSFLTSTLRNWVIKKNLWYCIQQINNSISSYRIRQTIIVNLHWVTLANHQYELGLFFRMARLQFQRFRQRIQNENVANFVWFLFSFQFHS